MYRKTQIVTIESSLIYLKYTVDLGYQVTVQIVNPITLEAEYMLERVNSISAALRTDQFVVDDDISAIMVNLANKGKKAIITYYTDGTYNPFYASSNLHTFITKVLKWTDNRIVDGLYIYWDYESCGMDYSPIKKLKEGSFVYDGKYHIYKGGTFDIRDYAPPTVVGLYRAYKIFINAEIISSYLDNKTNLLTQVGILTSDEQHTEVDRAKLDVITKYNNIYVSEPLNICYMYVRLNADRSFDIWMEYPSEQRTL